MIGLDNYVGPYPALTERDRRAIVWAWEHGCSPSELARLYGVSVRTVHRYTLAAVGRRRRHPTGPRR